VFIAGLYWWTRSEWLFWATATAYLLAACYTAPPDPSPGPARDAQIAVWELAALLGLCGVALLLGLGTNVPNADDSYFVSQAASALDYPEAPLFGFDNLHKSGLPLVQQSMHFGQVYEYLVAVLASFTHLPVRVLYYVVLPALWLPIGILAHWSLLRRWLPAGPALVGLASLIVLLAVWGDGLCTYGRFAFVRVFQGKAILILVATPLIVRAALEYLDKPTWQRWVLLMLYQCAAVSLTTTAQVVAPLAAGLVLLSRLTLSPARWRTVLAALFASSPVVLIGVAMLWLLSTYHSFGQEADLLIGYPIVFGSRRTSLVLAGLLLLPALGTRARLREAQWLSRYLALSVALLLCPAVPQFLAAYLSRVLSWRVFWCWPVPLLLGLAMGTAACRSLARPWLRASLLAAALAAFVFAGPSTVTSQNWAWANVGAFKVNEDYAVAERLMSVAPRGGLALVPEGVALSLSGFQHAPPLVVVRRMYIEWLHGAIPEADKTARLDLQAYISGAADRRSTHWAIGEMTRRGVTTVALRKTHPDAERLAQALAERGFVRMRFAGFWLFTRSASAK
jgi:hypothetical protein